MFKNVLVGVDGRPNGRDAIDRFNAALISVARGAWPDRWTELTPSPVVLSPGWATTRMDGPISAGGTRFGSGWR